MLNYMNRVGDETFSSLPFTPVDNLIFAQLSYCVYDDVKDRLPCPLRTITDGMGYGVIAKNEELFRLARTLPRYRESIPLYYRCEFSEKETKQFAAIAFLLTDGTAYVSFRGTDSTLVGWKEDFMLSFSTPVPAQERAAKYLDEVASVLDCPLRVGGHSKGGNLAVYASAFCSRRTQDHILAVYSNDGPGFEREVLETEEYQRIRPRVQRFLPESSIIGKLLENDAKAVIIDSDSVGILQHNPYSWKTEGDHFITKEATTLSSDLMNASLRGWLKRMDEEKRRFLTDTLFDILGAGDADTLSEALRSPSGLKSVISAAARLDAEDRQKLLELASALARAAYSGTGRVLMKRINTVIEKLTE